MPRYLYVWDDDGKARKLPVPSPFPTVQKVTATSLPQMMEKMNEVIDLVNKLNNLLLPPPSQPPVP